MVPQDREEGRPGLTNLISDRLSPAARSPSRTAVKRSTPNRRGIPARSMSHTRQFIVRIAQPTPSG